MSAAEFQVCRSEDGAYRQESLETPPTTLQGGEVLVRPQLVGICGSDLVAHTECQNLGRCFGHEWLGEVAEIGAGVRTLEVGDQATSGAFIGCGVCETCRRGASNFCPRSSVLGSGPLGASRSWLVLPEAELVRAPQYMHDSGILLEPASVAVTVLDAVERIGAREPEVLVVGAGAIGLLTTLLLQDRGARVTVLDRCPTRREAAAELGAETLDPGDAERMASLSRSFPTLVDCAHGRDGGRGGWEYVPGLVRRSGAIIGVAKYPSGTTLELDAMAGLTVTWLRGAPRSALAEAAERWPRLLHDRHSWLVSDEFPVERLDHAIEHALDTEKSRKVTLRIAD